MKRHMLSGPIRTLDAGCGSGAFTMYAAKLGNDTLGISFDEANNRLAAERAQLLGLNNVRFITGDLRNLDQMGGSLGKFDQIICSEVIEHLFNDQKLLDDLSALLKPGGRLILTTPYKHGTPIPGDKLSVVEDGGHVRVGYTHEELRQMFARAGLAVLAQDYISGIVTQKIIGAMRRLTTVNARIAWALTFPLRIFIPLDPFLTRAMAYPYYIVGTLGVKLPDNA